MGLVSGISLRLLFRIHPQGEQRIKDFTIETSTDGVNFTRMATNPSPPWVHKRIIPLQRFDRRIWRWLRLPRRAHHYQRCKSVSASPHRFCILILHPFHPVISEKLIICHIGRRMHCRRIASHHCPRLYTTVDFGSASGYSQLVSPRHMGRSPFRIGTLKGNYAICVFRGSADDRRLHCPGHRARRTTFKIWLSNTFGARIDPDRSIHAHSRDEICPCGNAAPGQRTCHAHWHRRQFLLPSMATT